MFSYSNFYQLLHMLHSDIWVTHVILNRSEKTWMYIYTPQSCCTGFTPSVRPASRVRSVAPTVLVGSILYLYILSSNYRRCAACKGFCKICIFANFYNFWLCLVLTWDLMWIPSMGNHGAAGGISEHRRSSCSICISYQLTKMRWCRYRKISNISRT